MTAHQTAAPVGGCESLGKFWLSAARDNALSAVQKEQPNQGDVRKWRDAVGAADIQETEMPKTVTRLFASLADAKTAVAALEGIGVRYAEISVISGAAEDRRRAGPGEHLGDHDRILGEEAKKGGEGGAVVGTGVGLLAGMALLPIPGLGPVLAVGWLVATLGTALGGAAIGAAAGGLVATLTHHGIEETEAHLIAEAVRGGDTLVSARVDDAKYEQAEALMEGLNAVNAATRGDPSRSAGLPEPEPATSPLADNRFERSPPVA